MAQHDYVIDNSTGANVRADINSVLQAISSNNSGSSAPSTTYALQNFANTTDSMLQLRNAANNAFVNLRKFDGALPLPDGSVSSPSLFFDDDTNTGLFSSAADTLNVVTGGAERFRVNSSGQFLLGTETAIGDDSTTVGALNIKFDNNTKFGISTQALVSGSATHLKFYNSAGTNTGSIVTNNAGATSYNTSSDYRLKENEVAISDGITRIKQLKPYKFNFKADSGTILDGFLAHEVSSVVPEAITGTKDEVNSDNKPIYQGIDQSKLVPLLVAAVQELINKVEALESA